MRPGHVPGFRHHRVGTRLAVPLAALATEGLNE